jgi:dipeptidyl aminopeptidase/acylaminoacyl peptidase
MLLRARVWSACGAHSVTEPRRIASRRAMAAAASAANDGAYRTGPPEVAAFAVRPETPGLTLSPNRQWLLHLHRPSAYPPVAELARPELKLAGIRFDLEQNSRSRMGYNTALALARLRPGAEPEEPRFITGIPPGTLLNYVSWSPSGTRIAFTVRGSGEEGCPPRGPPSLWYADVDTLQAHPAAPGWTLNIALEDYSWVSDSEIVALVIPQSRGAAPVRPATPAGPRISSSTGGVSAQARTYPDLLKDSHDVSMFTHVASSQMVSIRLGEKPEVRLLGRGAETRLYTRIDISSDSSCMLVEYLEPPFSFTLPASRFPKRVEVWSATDGSLLRTVSVLPLADAIPIVNDSCRAGPRGVGWRADAPATLVWTEAQDGGDPRVAASPRDIVYYAHCLPAAPAEAQPAARELLRTEWRSGGISWGDDRLALAYESQYKSRTQKCYAFAPAERVDLPVDAPTPPPLRLFSERNYEDSYSDPGAPLRRRTADATYVLAILEPPDVEQARKAGKGEIPGRRLLFQGSGDTAEGKKPFMDLVSCDSAKPLRRLFACEAKESLEYPSSIVSDVSGPITLDGLAVLLTRETPSEVPQYHVLTYKAEGAGDDAPLTTSTVQISDFPHPHPQLIAPPKELLRYTRAGDSLPLSATLYTPPGWRRGIDPPLPMLLWAYPREFKSAAEAGQLRDSPLRFTSIGALSPLVWLARGYAVLDGPTLPIIAPDGGEGNDMNDSYVEQLVAGAEAAVAKVVEMGVAAPGRIAVGGRSYGAFMCANLLAHCGHLFCAGVAQAGAYNRTLTPFGFQAEERTLWQAPEVYSKMSPFMHAHTIKAPILLIHGEEDTNTGTFPMQSERFFAALKGHGCEAKLVLLPHESHSYGGLESVLHIQAEMSDWLDKHTAAKPAAAAAPGE